VGHLSQAAGGGRVTWAGRPTGHAARSTGDHRSWSSSLSRAWGSRTATEKTDERGARRAGARHRCHARHCHLSGV